MTDTAPGMALDAPLQAALDAALSSGQAHAHPALWLRIHALAQRTRTQPDGPVRRLLHTRLHTLLAALPPAPAPASTPAPAPAASPLRPLLDTLQAALQARLPAAAAADTAAPGSPWPADAAMTHALASAPAHGLAPLLPELHAVARHRATWARLRAEQRLAQTHTALPTQAGPMNSQRLLHGALALMRDTAPGYLSHLMAQAEALMWLERALPAAAPAPAKASARATPARAPRPAKAPARRSPR